MLRTHFSFIDDERTRRVNHKSKPPALDADVYLENGDSVSLALEISDRRKLVFIKNKLTLDNGTFSTRVRLRAASVTIYDLNVPPGDAGFSIPVDASVDEIVITGNGSEPGKVRVVEL